MLLSCNQFTMSPCVLNKLFLQQFAQKNSPPREAYASLGDGFDISVVSVLCDVAWLSVRLGSGEGLRRC